MITPLDKGSLVHDALEQFLLDACSTGPIAERAAAGPAVDRRRPRAAAGDRRAPSATSTRPRAWSAAPSSGPATAAASSPTSTPPSSSTPPTASPTAPRRSSPSSASGSSTSRSTAVEVALPDGRTLRVRGRIDRVDISRDGTVHVVDYKTGSLPPAATATCLRTTRSAAAPSCSSRSTAWPAGSRVKDPTAPVRAEYWFVTTQGRASRGAATTSPTTVLERRPSRCSTTSSPASTTACSRRDPPRCRPSSASSATSATPTASAPPSCASSGSASATTPPCARYADLAEPLEDDAAERLSGQAERRRRRARSPLRSTDTGPSSLTTITVAVGSS